VGRSAVVTNGPAPDRQRGEDFLQGFFRPGLSVGPGAVRQILEALSHQRLEDLVQYALLAYGSQRTQADRVQEAIADVLAKPCVTGWARLHADESATTVRNGEGRTLLTDGPFIDTKEFLAGIIVVEADNLDAALEIAQELQDTRTSGAIEVRPILEALFHGA
jgi:hypothetical protein